jgi:polysaccharide biosynthesis/export protein
MTRHAVVSALSVALALALAAPARAQQPNRPAAGAAAPTAAQPSGSPMEQFRIGPEDVLTISVWKNEALTRSVPVRPDGMISLPLLDDVQAAGLTPMQLRDVLAKRLAEYMPTPEVSVIVTAINSFKVTVIGEVTRVGRYELKSWTTMLDLLAQAGGFTQFASRSRIVVLRANGKTMTRLPFNYNKVLSGDEENFYLLPGDIVLVP